VQSTARKAELTRYVAFIRGINLGRAKKIAMAELREALEGLGYDDVRTVLNSGNAIFTSARSRVKVVAEFEKMLADRFGIETRVIVLTAPEPLADVATNLAHLTVAFVAGPGFRTALAPLLAEDWSPEALAVGDHAVYFWLPNGVAASPLVAAVDRVIGASMTMRGANTVLRIQRLLAEAEEAGHR